MRFGKKLALAMIRDAGEAPYLSQKELKHVLVGLEKLCKAFFDQQRNVMEGADLAGVVEYAKEQREAYNVPPSDGLLNIDEIVSKDSDFIAILLSDVTKIRRYMEVCEAALMEAVNDWLSAADEANILIGPRVTNLGFDAEQVASFFLANSENSNFLDDSAPENLFSEFERIKAYCDVNLSAIRKLLQRRTKNVPECFWSRDEFSEISLIQSPEFSHIEETIKAVQSLCARE
jgi:hypothetical protein